MIQTETPTFYSERAAAREIGCSYATLRNLRLNGAVTPSAQDQAGNPLYSPEVVAQLKLTYVDGRTKRAHN